MKIESLFSAKKRRGGHTKQRIRASEKRELPYLTYPPDLSNKVERFEGGIVYGPPAYGKAQELRSLICRMIAKRRVGQSRQNEMLSRAIMKWAISCAHCSASVLVIGPAFSP